MRGTIFAQRDHNHKPRFVTVSRQLSDIEIYEAEKELIEQDYQPIPTEEEFFKTVNYS